MIAQAGPDTALLVIDAQKGVNDLAHWGGPTGRRNNPGAEAAIAALLAGWRGRGLPILYTAHNSREAHSPLKLGTPGGEFLPGLEPGDGETVIVKDVNGGFTGTGLEIALRRRGIHRLVICGYFTNFCVETTARSAGNRGYDTYVVHDACATSNRIGHDGRDHDPELVHDLALASLNREFCTVIGARDALGLLEADAEHLERRQGNE